MCSWSKSLVAGLVGSLCSLVGMPSTGSAQSCSECDWCPYDSSLTYFSDGGEIAWLYPQCEDVNCAELIECPPEDDDQELDLDVLASAVSSGTWSVVESMIDATDRVSFHEGRNALVVSGCRAGSIAAILPVPADLMLATRLAHRIRVAGFRRAVLATFSEGPAA